MKSILFLWISITSTLWLGAQETTTISSADISFVFVSKNVDGHISGFESASTLDLKDFSRSKLKGSVAVETLKTGNFIRDWSLRGGKYFDADAHPKITFESEQIVKTDNGFRVKGPLTIKDVQKAVTFDFMLKDHQLVGTTTLFSSDFGIDIKDDREDNEVKVKLVFSLASRNAQQRP